MVDLTEEERAAVTATMKRVALLMDEIGWQTAFADLTEAQVRALIEEAVEGFRARNCDCHFGCLNFKIYVTLINIGL